jgi:hypothetical protein
MAKKPAASPKANRRGRSNQAKQRAMDTLLRAVTHPTDEHVDAALNHPELKKALEGLDRKDFQSLSKVVAPYLSLKNGVLNPTPENITAMSANHQLTEFASKLSPDDLKTIGNVMKATASHSNCGDQICS